jgi:hypothetical protein
LIEYYINRETIKQENFEMKIIYTGENVSKESIQWGSHTSPVGILEPGNEYDLEKEEMHSWHTRIYLKGIDGYFNSVWFDEPTTQHLNRRSNESRKSARKSDILN